MNVLSLFDGISCGRIALDRAGIKVNKYYSSEINKYAIQTSQKNYPDIIQLGNVKDIHGMQDIDLLIGGSPCQDLCPASCGSVKESKKGLDGEKSSLFYEYVRILNETKPKYFLFENVASMKQDNKNIISSYFNVEPIMINSSLVSAQNRKRLYWTNIPNISQPQNKGITLKDVLISKNSVPKNMFHTEKAIALMNREVGNTGRKRLYNGQGVTFINSEKSGTITANFRKGVPYNVLVYSENEMRKLTPEECELLQTLPLGYTRGVSDSRRYECIGNGWTVDVIAHILSYLN